MCNLSVFGHARLTRSTYKVSPGRSLLRLLKTVGSDWYLVIVLLRFMAYETVKCFVEKHIHCSLKPELNFEIEEQKLLSRQLVLF